MQFPTTTLLALIPLLAGAAPVDTCPGGGNSGVPAAFTVTSARSGSPIQYLPMNAADQKFWLGGQTATYCPTEINPCPPGNVTVIAGGGSLDTEVPGGQQIYVAPDGSLSFTQAHSAAIPPGSSVGPFSVTAGARFATYSTSAFGATGFMACPNTIPNPSTWQVFAAIHNATVPTGKVGECLGFDAIAINYTGSVPAWQYT